MKKIELSIQKPCHENWDNMTPDEKGRFCAVCQKIVIDFTTMSDRKIADYFKKPAGAVCGQFSQSQLNRVMEVPKKRLPWVKYFFTISLPAFLLSLKSGAQPETRLRGRIAVKTVPVKDSCQKPVDQNEAPKMVEGRVVDEQDNPVVKARIVVAGTMQTTLTNSEGKFQIEYPGSENTVLHITYVGHEERSVSVRELLADKEVKIVLNPLMLGEVAVTKVVKKTSPIIPLLQPKKMDTAFSKFSVFPNPLLSGSTFTIDASGADPGTYLVQIMTSTGEVVQENEISIEKKRKQVSLGVGAVAAGPYFIQLINKKNKKNYTEIIIIQ